MMKTAQLSVILAFGVFACGGADKPAQDSSKPAATFSPTPPPGSADMAPVTNTSEETTKGIAALQAGDAQSAKVYFETALKKHPHEAEAFHYTGVADEKLGDKVGAEKAYKDALKIKPDLAESLGNLAALYIDAKRWDDAIALLKPAVAKQGDRVELHTNLALALAGKGDQPGSTSEFESAIKLSPNDAMLVFMYADSLRGFAATSPDQAENALAKLRLARGAAGESADLLAAIGHDFLLLRATGDCVPTFDKAIAIKDAASFRTERGLCKLGAKDAFGAQVDFQAAVAKEPNFPLAHYWLGYSLLNAKKKADAIKELETYLKLEPNGTKSKQAQDALAKAKGKK